MCKGPGEGGNVEGQCKESQEGEKAKIQGRVAGSESRKSGMLGIFFV